MDEVLKLMGLALRSKNLAAGEEVVSDAVSAHRARLLLLAGDAGESTRRRAGRLAGERLPVLTLPADKATVGAALGKTSCAVSAVLEAGFAARIAAKLAEGNPAYRETAEKLEQKQEKRLRRKKEKPRKK